MKQSDPSDPSQRTIVVFGGNGFVGRRICEQALNRSYRVIAVSRSGINDIYASQEWTKKVEWFNADALKPETYAEYISAQEPYAIFTMIGVVDPIKQTFGDASMVRKYSGTTNVNVCNMAKDIESVKKFVFIGADVQNMGINTDPDKYKYKLWSRFWIGQYLGKSDVEKCVKSNFGGNGISFRPEMIAGKVSQEIFGQKFTWHRVPFWDTDWVQNIYRSLLPLTLDVNDLAKDCLDFIEGKKDNFHSPRHSLRADQPTDKKWIYENMDNIISIGISIVAMTLTYYVLKCAFGG